MSAPVAALHAWLAARAGPMTALLSRLVSLESPSTVPSSLAPLQQVVEDLLAQRGFSSRRVAGVTTAGWTVSHRSRDPHDVAPQLLVGHLDTVWPLGTLARRRPLATDGRIRGPGAYDMKAGIVQLVYALGAIEALDLRVAVPPVVLCTTDEEIGSPESTPALIALARAADRALVLEPSLGPTGRIKTARKGVGRFTITVRGRAAHAGLDPTAGASAILELAHVVQSLFAMNDPAAGVSVNVGTVDGGLRPNVVAPRSVAVVDVRVATAADGERVTAAIRGLAPTTEGTEISVEGGIGRPPMERSRGTAALWSVVAGAAAQLGLELAEGTAGGGSDGNTTALLAPTLDGLGAVGDGAHAEHEYVELDRLPERATLLAALLLAPPVARPRRAAPPGGLPALLASLPAPAATGSVTPAVALRAALAGAGAQGRGE